MTYDESPADAAAQSAGPPEDDARHSGSPPEKAAASTRRRRTTTSRSTRANKTTPPDPILAPVETMAPVESPPSAPSDTAFHPVVEAAPDTALAKPSRAPRRRTTRTKPDPPPEVEAPITPPPSPEPPAAQIADIGTLPTAEAPSAVPETVEKAKPARRRTARGRKTEPAVPPPVEMEAPVVETPEVIEPVAAAPEAPVRPSGRRRGGRSRRKAEPTPESVAAPPEAPAPAIETPTEAKPSRRSRARARKEAVVTPTVEEAIPAPPVEAPPVEEKPARGRRGARKRAEPVEDLTRGARLVTRRGLAELHIHGQPVPPVLFFGNVEGEKEARRVASEVQRAARAGVHLHSTLVELPCPLPPDDSVYETIDSRIETLLEADPQGYVIPRLVFMPAPGWRKQYPNEVIHYADGTTGDPSIASDRFWQEAEYALSALIDHIHRTTYSERVAGYHLERGEWFHPADTGYDRSFANREAFRTWLRSKYKNSEAALRAAWYDGQVQFYTAEIPPMPGPPRPEIAFYEPRKERRLIDFLEFTSEITADRLIALSKVVKQASNNAALVSVCYGYTFEFGHAYSGHLALGRLLSAPTVDIICGPPSYRDRLAGEAGSLPAPVDSTHVHGKLWLSENDTKTHLAPGKDSPDDYNPRIDNRAATEQVHLRAMGQAMAHQSAVAWMDLWGEGWLDAEDIWDRIGTFTERYQSYIKQRRAVTPEVVVLVGERSLLHVQKGEAFLRRLLQEQRDMILRSGASVGFYLQSDIMSRNFPTDAKLYLFLDPYRLPAEQRAAIKEKLQTGNKTLVWMYAVGVCDERGQPEESANDIIGITLRAQSWNAELGSRIADTRHPITERIQNRNLGVRERLNPSYYVDDDDRNVVVLAEYQQSGLPSVAVRQFDGWRSVFCGEPTLTVDLLRGLCRYAGVHLYTPGADDYVYAGDGWVTLHATRDGQRSLLLPQPMALYDLNESRLLGEDLREYRLNLRGRTTRNFFIGTPEEMRKLGLPGVERSRRGRRRGAQAEDTGTAGEMEVEEIVTTVEVSLDEAEGQMPTPPIPGLDDEAVLAVDSEDAAEAQGDDSGPRRRRRRRGGRGRGRRRGPNGSGPAGESGGAPSPPAGE